MRRVSSLLVWLVWMPAALVAQDQDPDQSRIQRRARAIAGNAPAVHAPRPRTMDVLHYDARLRVDLELRSISGEVKVRFQPYPTAQRRIELDAQGLSIRGVESEDQTSLEFEQDGTSLWVDLGREVPADVTREVLVRYAGSPRTGLIFATDPGGQTQVWSQGQSRTTRAWLPCRDHPDDRATLDLAVTVRDEHVTVGNGVLVESRDNGDGWRTDHWRMGQPFPSYLTNLVIGDLQAIDLGQVDRVVLQGFCHETDVEAAGRALARTGRVLAWMQDLTGVAYPYAAYRQTFAAEFPFGGMENVTSTTLGREILYPEVEAAERAIEADALVVHELAHHWWGNLVTPAQWEDLWLSEGLATYAEVLWLEQTRGRDEALLVLLAQQKAATDVLTDSGRCIVDATYTYPDDRFDEHVYQAGSAFLHLLRRVLGDEAFFASLREWTASMRNRCVRTADFEELFARRPETDLAPLFAEWLHAPGLPDLRFSWRHQPDAGELVLEVEQRQSGAGVPEVYHLPVPVLIATAAGARREVVTLDARAQEFRVTCPEAPAFVRFNVDAALFGRIVVQQPLTCWQEQLRSDPDSLGRTEAANRLGVLGARLDRNADPGPEGNDWTRTLSALGRAAMHDESFLVRMAAVDSLGVLGGETALLALDCALLDEDLRVRVAAAKALGNFKGDDRVAELIVTRFALEPSLAVHSAMVDSIGALEVDSGPHMLLQMARTDEFPLRLRGMALIALAKAGGDGSVDLAVNMSRHDQPVELRVAAIEALGAVAGQRPRARRTLVGLLEDPSAKVVYAVLDALEGVSGGSLVPALVRFHDQAPYEDMKTAASRLLAPLLMN